MFTWLNSLFKGSAGDSGISVDDIGVSVRLADGTTESVQWDELIEVSVVTNDKGPFEEDTFFVLRSENSGCVVPGLRSAALLRRIQKLPGFDNEKVIEAMGSTSNARFICWQRKQ